MSDTATILWSNINACKYAWRLLKDFTAFKLREFAFWLLDAGTVVHHSASLRIVKYYDGDNEYEVRFPVRRGPGRIQQIVDQNGGDISPQVFKAMGPGKNFHGIPTTPRMLGYDSITLRKFDDTAVTFGADDVITF